MPGRRLALEFVAERGDGGVRGRDLGSVGVAFRVHARDTERSYGV